MSNNQLTNDKISDNNNDVNINERSNLNNSKSSSSSLLPPPNTSSFNWPSLKRYTNSTSSLPKEIPDSGDKIKQLTNENQQSQGLSLINEASNENSETTTRRTSLTNTIITVSKNEPNNRWWYWMTRSNPNENIGESDKEGEGDREREEVNEGNDSEENVQMNMGQATIQETSTQVISNDWSSWLSPYRRITEAVNYVYPSTIDTTQEVTPINEERTTNDERITHDEIHNGNNGIGNTSDHDKDEVRPNNDNTKSKNNNNINDNVTINVNEPTSINNNNDTNGNRDNKLNEITNSNNNNNNNTWWNWVWGNQQMIEEEIGDEEYDDENNNNSELFKQAKQFIENSRDSSNYAIKSSNNLKNYELSVSDTKTEIQPVKYKTKRRPITPNEAQENNILQHQKSMEDNLALQSKNNNNNTNEEISNNNKNGDKDELQPNLNNITESGSSTTSSIKSNKNRSTPPPVNKSTKNRSTPPPDKSNKVRSTTPPLNKSNKREQHNLIIPNFEENFRTITLKTKLRLIGEHLIYQNKSSEKHLYRLKQENILKRKQIKIKKVVIIGIHDFLPIKLVRTLIGQSTGSSIKYVDIASKCIRQWMKENRDGAEEDEDEEEEEGIDITNISLEGEGKIEERVAKLNKLIINWSTIINEADFIFFISQSGSTPIAIKLLNSMFENNEFFKIDNKKIGLLSISGNFHGSFRGTNSKIVIRAYTSIENEIINEFFEYQKPRSEVSLNLTKNLCQLINKKNVKIILSGSINDQFIPIYLSLAGNFNHPNIYRNIFMSTNSVPKFIITLIKICLMMKNNGYSDHNLIKDLSERCQGNLGNEGGHGKIFDNEIIYMEAIKFCLETTSLKQDRNIIINGIEDGKEDKNTTEDNFNSSLLSVNALNHDIGSINNLYHIPWNIRGLLQDLIKIKHIGNYSLIIELIEDYKNWEPISKQWKDFKYCLGAIEDLNFEELLI